MSESGEIMQRASSVKGSGKLIGAQKTAAKLLMQLESAMETIEELEREAAMDLSLLKMFPQAAIVFLKNLFQLGE